MTAADLKIALITDPGAGDLYEALVPGPAGPWFENVASGSRIALGANPTGSAQEGPVAVALATRTPERLCLDLNWIYVREHFRWRGIARALLARIEELARQSGYERVGATYNDDTPGRRPLRHLLEHTGWTCREPAFVRATGGSSIMAAPWISSRLPRAFVLGAWSEITADERARLEADEQMGPSGRENYGFPSPLARDQAVEPRASFWLRYQGEIVGWLKAVRTAPGAVEYSSLYVHPPHQRSGRAIQMLAEGIRNAAVAGYQTASFLVDVENRPMMRFVKRRLVPYGVTVEEIHRAQKLLE